MPLVGVWVSGVSSATHPIVWLACLKYYASSQLKDKTSQGDQAFLLLLYASGEMPLAACLDTCCLLVLWLLDYWFLVEAHILSGVNCLFQRLKYQTAHQELACRLLM